MNPANDTYRVYSNNILHERGGEPTEGLIVARFGIYSPRMTNVGMNPIKTDIKLLLDEYSPQLWG